MGDKAEIKAPVAVAVLRSSSMQSARIGGAWRTAVAAFHCCVRCDIATHVEHVYVVLSHTGNSYIE